MDNPKHSSQVKREQPRPGVLFFAFSYLITAVFAVLFFVPVMIVNFIYAYVHRPNAIEVNKSRGQAIMGKCQELGVPLKDYYQITWNLMDVAKQRALEMGEPGGQYSEDSWNTRLAYAIAEIYFSLHKGTSHTVRDN